MTDIASLKIEVDSSAVRKATDDLRDMAAAAQDCQHDIESLIVLAKRHGLTPFALETAARVGDMETIYRVEVGPE
jgi:hypothetical protein